MPEPLDTARRVNRGEPMSLAELQRARRALAGRSWLHRAEVEDARRRVDERIEALTAEPRASSACLSMPVAAPRPRRSARPTAGVGTASPASAGERLLAEAQAAYDRAEARMNNGPQTKARLERLFLSAADALAAARSPKLAEAWVGVALVRRYQSGRAAESLDAFHRALAADPHNERAVDAYVDFMRFWASAAGLTETLCTITPELRPERLPLLVSTARRQDQWGNMPPGEGERWLAELPDLLRRLGDAPSLGWVLSARGLEEERTGSHDRALRLLRDAAATGYPTAQAVDRLTVRLVQNGEYAEAAAALKAAVARPISSDSLRQRLAARLRRCERELDRPAPAPPRPAATLPAIAADVSPGAIRAWARDQGYDVGNRGRLPTELIAAYLEAHRPEDH